MIAYGTSVGELTANDLQGFWVGWPSPPSTETHLRLLQNSDYVVLAIDQSSGRVVGFITAITDHVLFAYIPLLEVLPEYRGQGIGQGLVKRMLEKLSGYYQVDLMCDPNLQPFYARQGMRAATGMTVVDYTRQSGLPPFSGPEQV